MQILSNYGLEFKKTIGLGWIKGEVKEVKKAKYSSSNWMEQLKYFKTGKSFISKY